MDSEHKVESCSWHFPYRRRWHQSVPVWELQLALSCIGGAGITHFPIVLDTQTVRVWPCAAVGFNCGWLCCQALLCRGHHMLQK